MLAKLGTTSGALKTILGTNQALALSFGAISSSIFYFISSLDKMGSTAKWLVPTLAAVAAGITAIVVALAGLRGKALITATTLAGAIALAAGTAISTAIYQSQNSAKSAVQGYAEGGLPDKGTMFIAGEAGAEMVYNMPSGQSGVANVSQIEQAFYNALVRYGRENRGSDGAINVNIDGQAVFKAVDREAGKRGLGFARR